MNKLIAQFGKEKRWVHYKFSTRKGKITKVPYSPVTGKMASSTNAADWSTYKEAIKATDHVGIVFTPEKNLLGIDIDHCLTNKKITHEQKETIADFILATETYTEISPSGEGLHLFLKIDGKLDLVSNKCAPFECYTSGRYFTFTGNVYGEENEVRTVTPDEAIKLLKIIGYPWKSQEDSKKVLSPQSTELSTVLTDVQVIEKMLSANEKAKPLYAGDLSNYGGDASSADMGLLSYLAYWTRKDAAQMERIWLASPLGDRKKTQERMDYRKRSVAAAIKNCKKVYETSEMRLAAIQPGLELLYTIGERGKKNYTMNTENMCRILRGHKDFVGRFRYDVFRNVLEIKDKGKWRGIEDNDSVNIQTLISIHFSEFFGMVGKNMVYDAIIKVAKENMIDSATDYIKSIVWDKKPRLDDWLHETCGVPKTEYFQAVASNWFKGLVKRIVEPGCKFDYVLVLEGAQGVKKSTLLYTLGGDWYVETAMSTDSKDFFMQFQGKAIIEFSEGETLSRTEVKRMKAIITMQSDKYRPPYERTSQDFPRRCVFAMTTNQTEYLKDETGNRRWLPVAVMLPEINVQWMIDNRDQLFAEAYHRVVTLKESIHEFPREATLAQQEARRVSDPHQDKIMEWYVKKVSDADKEQGITIDRVYKECLHGNFPSRPMMKHEQMSIASVLEIIGLVKRREMNDNVRSIRWYNDRKLPLSPVEETMQEAALRNF